MKEWGEAGIFSQMTLFVEETCRLFQYGMEWEDCLQTGWLALEEARKSYPRVCGRYPFWDYVFLKIRDGIQSAQKEWYNGRPYKTRSLDQTRREASGQPVIPFSKTDVFLSRPWI